MKHQSAKTLLAVLLGTGLSATALQAQNPFFETGDLILYFQKPGENTVFVGLGSAAVLYRGAAAGATADRQALNIVNISAALSEAFGPEWASDPDIYAGAAGCRSSDFGEDVVDGDQNRTIYLSRSRSAVGTLGQINSTPWDIRQAASNTTGATSIIGLANDFETNHVTKVAIAPSSSSKIDDTNPITNVSLGIQGAAFQSAFAGGVQQRGRVAAFGDFGPAGSVEFALDLNRIVALVDSATEGEVSGVRSIGSYEGTIVVGTDGNVSFITQSAAPTATPFQTWALTFSALNTEAKRLPAADPDNDGLTNLVEFVLNGNPGVSDGGAVSPTLNASGSNFVFSFSRRDDAVAGNTLTFEYGENLATWTSVPIGATGSTVGSATVGIVTSSNPDVVTVTLPKSVSTTGKLFGRIKVTQP